MSIQNAQDRKSIRKEVRQNFSIDEAAIVLGMDTAEVCFLIDRRLLRFYTTQGSEELRTTRMDLFEYSMISGRRLSF